MPRQKGAVPLTVRVRDNQRRSRARQKELIQDMRTRIQEYEQREIQASLELQQAARAVAWENKALRTLMASRGITGHEIERYLEDCRQGVTPPHLVQFRKETLSHGSTSLTSSDIHLSPVPMSKPNASEQTRLNGTMTIPEEILPSAQAIPFVDFVPSSLQSMPHVDDSRTDDVLSHNAPEETSCEVAASIIASMRWQGSEEEARAKLGCDGQKQCTIKNTALFQIIDST